MTNKFKKSLLRKTSVILSGIAMALPVYAETKEVNIGDVTTLVISEDVKATVKCSNENKVKVVADNLSELIVNDRSGTLEIEYDSGYSIFDLIKKDKAEVDIFVTSKKMINTVVASKGAQVFVDACAVNKDSLNVDSTMGASVNVTGKTEKLRIDASMGGTFNENSHPKFSAETADVSIRMGGEAYFCNVKQVTGVIKMGGIVNLDKKAKVSIRTSMGGSYDTHSYFNGCK